MKKSALLLCTAGLILTSATSSWARLWNDSKIIVGSSTFACGPAPSIALLYGVQPVVSNYYYQGSMPPLTVVHQTAFGWETYNLQPGYIAGDGGRTIVSFTTPITYGQDGDFYATSANPDLRPFSWHGGDGPVWPHGSGPYGIVSTDPAGALYMVVGANVARSVGSVWSQPVRLNSMFGTFVATDLAVSPFGDIAVAGLGPSSAKTVSWFDFKSATWMQRTLGAVGNEKVDVEWDRAGNLGVAYSDRSSGNLKFDYLNMGTGLWTTEVVNSAPAASFLGAALAFDRFGDPVIASGSELFYDPSGVPEPSAVVTLLGGIAGLAWARRRTA